MHNHHLQIINQLLKIDQHNTKLSHARTLIGTLDITPIYPIILVGGTNGKGSTCAYLTNILKIAGYKVGTFTSPHVFDYNERISINNIPINNQDLEMYLAKIANNSDYSLGLFQTFTLASHLYFMENTIDIAIFEVGIGGKNDITNLFEPTISAITGVELDHCAILGNTISEIAQEKAHIYRTNKWAFYGNANPPKSLLEYANKINAKLEYLNRDFGVSYNENSLNVWCNNKRFFGLPYPIIRNEIQIFNIALSLAILSKLESQFVIPLQAIKNAILQTKLAGRFEIMPGTPQIIFDVAHNPQAVQIMLQNMLKLPFVKQNFAVFGIAADKDFKKVIQLSHSRFDKWFIAKLGSNRGLDPEIIKNELMRYNVNPNNILIYDNIKLATQNAIKIATPTDRIVCFGSFLVVEASYLEYKGQIK